MKSSEQYLANYEVNTDSEKNFKLIPCSRKQYVMAFLLLGVILLIMLLLVFFANLNQWIVVYASLMSILVVFLTPIVWHKVFQRFIKYTIAPALEEYREVEGNTNVIKFFKDKMGKFLGLRFDPTLTYYIEAEPHDIDLTDSKILLKKAFDVTTTAIGFSFLATMVVSWVINITAENWYALLYLGVGFAFGSPLLISILIPILWTLEDTAVKSIDDKHQIRHVGFRIRERVFDRIIGKGGLIFGFSFIFNQITKLNAEAQAISSFGQFFWTLIVYLSMIILMGLPCILTTMRYLRLYHQENVTLTRNVLKTVLPIGFTVVKAEKK